MSYVLSTSTAELLEEFLEAEKAKHSMQGYRNLPGQARCLALWLEDEGLSPEEAGICDAVRYQAWLSQKLGANGKALSTGTMLNYLKAARRLYDHLVNREVVKSNPFRELRNPRMSQHLSRNVLTEAQMGRLLRELGKYDELGRKLERVRRYRVHVLGEFLYATGMRIAEASALTREDLDLAHRQVYVRCGKGGESRTAFLTGYACAVLERYLARGRAAVLKGYARGAKDRVFGAGRRSLIEIVNGELFRVCSALELPVITSHGFRYSLGTHLLRSGCDMRHIQAILGHEALGTTQVYTRVDKEDLKKSLDEHLPRQWRAQGARGGA